jgi:hypothetical protein
MCERLVHDPQALMMMGMQSIPIRESAGEVCQNRNDSRDPQVITLTLDDLAALHRVRVALHTAEHVNRCAAGADGDVQAAEHDPEQPELSDLRRRELARIGDVLAALRPRRSAVGAGAGAGRASRGRLERRARWLGRRRRPGRGGRLAGASGAPVRVRHGGDDADESESGDEGLGEHRGVRQA